MIVQGKKLLVVLACSFMALMVFSSGNAFAEGVNVAVLDMQKVLLSSSLGKQAQQDMEKKLKELEVAFKKDEDALKSLQEEIEKKSSVWSEEKKQDKAIEFQKLRRDLRVKQEDAQVELNQLRDKKMGPILKELEGVVTKFAKEKGYEMILPSQAVLYAVDSVDVTDEVTKALNAKSQK